MSKISKTVGRLLKKAFPGQTLKEEVYVNFLNSRLFFDFLLPELGVAVEVQGQQHFEEISHFHRRPDDFRDQKYRDMLKVNWCKENGTGFVTFNYDEVDDLTEAAVKRRIIEAMNNNGD